MALLYGVSALVLRELWVRGCLGFGHFVLFGAIFAGLNEGIVANTWFKLNPLNFKVSQLARIGGTNWHLVINLIMFHTLFSMAIPILLSMAAFSDLNKTPLLHRKSLLVCVGLLLFIGIGNIIPKHHLAVADSGHRIALLILLIVVAAIGVMIPPRQKQLAAQQTISTQKLVLIGTMYSVLFAISYFALPALVPKLSLVFSVAMYVSSIIVAIQITKKTTDVQQVLPLIGGLLIPSFFLSFAKIQIGQPIVIFIFGLFLWRLYALHTSNVIK